MRIASLKRNLILSNSLAIIVACRGASSVPAHLMDSKQLLTDLNNINSEDLTKFNYPFSLDVTALYTSILPQEAIRNIVERVEKNKRIIKPLSSKYIDELLSCILDNTIFEFKNVSYKQISGLPMGNSISGVAVLFMDTLERTALFNSTNIALYRRYIDDTFILTINKLEADKIFKVLNEQHPNIKFELEYPDENNSISLLDFKITIHKNGSYITEFYQKAAKIDLLPHFNSALPTTSKINIINNEIMRRKERCSDETMTNSHIQTFKQTLLRNGYPSSFCDNAITRKKTSARTQRDNNKMLYFEFPFICDKIDREIKKVFRDLNLPVRIYRKSFTLRNFLSTKNIKPSCNLTSCKLKNELCYAKYCVYKLTCTKCQEFYIGRTFREFHLRYNEHLKIKDSSVYNHMALCKTPLHATIIAKELDRIKLRFKEAILIDKEHPLINSRSEREELSTLIYNN